MNMGYSNQNARSHQGQNYSHNNPGNNNNLNFTNFNTGFYPNTGMGGTYGGSSSNYSISINNNFSGMKNIY